MSPFDFIRAASETKENLMRGTDNDDLAEKSYNAFIVNRGLSFFPDSILYVNEMNLRASLDGSPQFNYLLNTLRPRKRYSKWLKEEKIEDLDIITEYYQCSKRKAKEILRILNGDQLQLIKNKLEKGGVNTKEKKNDNQRGNIS